MFRESSGRISGNMLIVLSGEVIAWMFSEQGWQSCTGSLPEIFLQNNKQGILLEMNLWIYKSLNKQKKELKFMSTVLALVLDCRFPIKLNLMSDFSS